MAVMNFFFNFHNCIVNLKHFLWYGNFLAPQCQIPSYECDYNKYMSCL